MQNWYSHYGDLSKRVEDDDIKRDLQVACSSQATYLYS